MQHITEQDIQAALYDYRSFIAAFPTMVPNIYLWNWESDLLYLSRDLYVTEYEIKTSRADFCADKRKTRKHWRLSTDNAGPAYFYYVCPEDVISSDELPEYAGLIYISERKHFSVYSNPISKYKARRVIKAKRRKAEPLSAKRCRELLVKGVTRYWSLLRKVQQSPILKEAP